MALRRVAFAALVALALSAYALDCGAMSTPEQAMQCCDSMPCPPHAHDAQDCCQSAAAMHVPFVKPAAMQSEFPHFAEFAPSAIVQFALAAASERITPAVSHAPPILSAPIAAPLRI